MVDRVNERLTTIFVMKIVLITVLTALLVTNYMVVVVEFNWITCIFKVVKISNKDFYACKYTKESAEMILIGIVYKSTESRLIQKYIHLMLIYDKCNQYTINILFFWNLLTFFDLSKKKVSNSSKFRRNRKFP